MKTLREVMTKSKPYRYVKLVYPYGFEVCINIKIFEIGIRLYNIPLDQLIFVVDVQEVSFQYYLNCKKPLSLILSYIKVFQKHANFI
jgi:hypothetical protein